MKNVKAVLSLTLLISGIIMSTSVHAQVDSLTAPNQKKAAAFADRLKRDLQLSPAQTHDVELLINGRLTAIDQGKFNTAQQVKASNHESQKKLESILTKEQYQKYTALNADKQLQITRSAKKGASTLSKDDQAFNILN